MCNYYYIIQRCMGLITCALFKISTTINIMENDFGKNVKKHISPVTISKSYLFSFSASRQNKPSFNPADTNALVGAVAFGKGLSKCRPPGPVAPGMPGQGPMMSGGPTLQQVTIGGGSGQQAAMGGPVPPQQQGQQGEGTLTKASDLFDSISAVQLLKS